MTEEITQVHPNPLGLFMGPIKKARTENGTCQVQPEEPSKSTTVSFDSSAETSSSSLKLDGKQTKLMMLGATSDLTAVVAATQPSTETTSRPQLTKSSSFRPETKGRRKPPKKTPSGNFERQIDEPEASSDSQATAAVISEAIPSPPEEGMEKGSAHAADAGGGSDAAADEDAGKAAVVVVVAAAAAAAAAAADDDDDAGKSSAAAAADEDAGKLAEGGEGQSGEAEGAALSAERSYIFESRLEAAAALRKLGNARYGEASGTETPAASVSTAVAAATTAAATEKAEEAPPAAAVRVGGGGEAASTTGVAAAATAMESLASAGARMKSAAKAVELYCRAEYHLSFDEAQMFEFQEQHAAMVQSAKLPIHLNKGLALLRLVTEARTLTKEPGGQGDDNDAASEREKSLCTAEIVCQDDDDDGDDDDAGGEGGGGGDSRGRPARLLLLALRSARGALVIEGNHVKARCLEARCLQSLDRPQEALDALGKINLELPPVETIASTASTGSGGVAAASEESGHGGGGGGVLSEGDRKAIARLVRVSKKALKAGAELDKKVWGGKFVTSKAPPSPPLPVLSPSPSPSPSSSLEKAPHLRWWRWAGVAVVVAVLAVAVVPWAAMLRSSPSSFGGMPPASTLVKSQPPPPSPLHPSSMSSSPISANGKKKNAAEVGGGGVGDREQHGNGNSAGAIADTKKSEAPAWVKLVSSVFKKGPKGGVSGDTKKELPHWAKGVASVFKDAAEHAPDDLKWI